jgi:mono/diheme cytochrome c family protein
MNTLRLRYNVLLACLLALPAGVAAQERAHDPHAGHGGHAGHGQAMETPSSGGMDNDHGDHMGHDAHAGHDMDPQVTRGTWSYLDRDNPEPHDRERWVMVPVPGIEAGFRFVRSVDAAGVCAGLDERRVMVDRATREACNARPGALPFSGVAMAGPSGGQAGQGGHESGHAGHDTHGDHGSDQAQTGHMDHSDHGGHGSHESHGDHTSHDGHDDHGSHDSHGDHGDPGSHTGHDHEHHGSHDGHGWVAPPEAVAMANPVHANRESIRRGEDAYRAFCMSCHGAAGRGDGRAAGRLAAPPADLVAHGDHHTDGDLAWKIRTGNGAMPAFEEVLTDRQIWDVVNYLRTLAPGERTARRHNH